MVMFIVVLFTLLSAYIFSDVGMNRINADRMRRNYIISVSLLLILQSGLRNLAVGADTYAYSIAFDDISHWSWDDIRANFTTVYQQGEGKDAGFALIQKIFQLFSERFRVFLLSIAVFFFVSLGVIIYRNTERVVNVMFAYILYLTLFYSFFSITGIRQTIATSFVLLGVNFVQDKKIFKFLFCCILAFFIHKSAIIFLLVYPLYWFNKNQFVYTISAIMIMISFVFRRTVIEYSTYLYYNELRQGGLKEIPITFISFMIICYLIVFFNLDKFSVTRDDSLIGFCNVTTIGFILAPTIGADSGTMRIVQYFSIFLIIILPAIIDLYNSNRKMIYFVSVSLLLLVLLGRTNSYAFYWQPMMLGNNYKFEMIIQE